MTFTSKNFQTIQKQFLRIDFEAAPFGTVSFYSKNQEEINENYCNN